VASGDRGGDNSPAHLRGRPTLPGAAATFALVRERPERKNEALWAATTGVAVFLVTFARDPTAWKTIWAEDGTIFLTGAVDHGLGSFFHFYAGYLHTVPRIGALIAAALPLSIAPFVMTSFAVVIVSICAATVELLSGAYVQARWIRVGLGLCFGFLPAIRVESIANMANLQFFLIAASFWVLLVIPRTRAGRRVSSVFLAATAASTIVGFLLFPVALLRLLDRRNRLPAAVFAAVETLHGIVILIAQPGRQAKVGASLPNMARGFVYDVISSQFFGGPFSNLHHRRLTLILIAVVAIASAVLLFVKRPHQVGEQLVVAAGALVLAGACYVLEVATQDTSSRYVVLPAFLVLFGVGIIADVAFQLKGARPIAAVAALAVVLPWGISFHVVSERDTGPRWSAVYAQAQRACHGTTSSVHLQILPVLPVHFWTVTLPCSAIR
jgi:hypothetical protein